MEGQLRSGDFERISSGEERWRNAIGWTRQKLKEEGVLRSGSPYGVWNSTTNTRPDSRLRPSKGTPTLEPAASLRQA
jgi:hypothetical protein